MVILKLSAQREPRKRVKIDRQPYLDLVSLTPYSLCYFCKYADWEGSDCTDTELICEHPLDAISHGDGDEHPNNVWQGSDCWGFRPTKTLQEVGVFVGIHLEGNIPHYSASHGGELIAIVPSKRDLEERYW